MATNELIDELRTELEGDLIDYSWIIGTVKEFFPADPEVPITAVAYDAVVSLLNEGVVEIGDAHEVNGRVEFSSWSGSLEERKQRLEQVIGRLGTSPEMGEGFWLAKVE